jgi:hypothetical protein
MFHPAILPQTAAFFNQNSEVGGETGASANEDRQTVNTLD